MLVLYVQLNLIEIKEVEGGEQDDNADASAGAEPIRISSDEF